MKTQLKNLLNQAKENICGYLTDIYKHNNNGLLPNWEEDEEIILTNEEIGDIEINVYVEKKVIKQLIVTLDCNLYIICFDKYDLQFEWSDISAEDLISIHDNIRKKYHEIFG